MIDNTDAVSKDIQDMVGKLEAIHGSTWRTPALCAHRRPGERHLRAVLRCARSRNSRSRANLCGTPRRRWESDYLRRMKRVSAKGLHRIEVRDRNGELSEVTQELKWKRIQVLSAHWQKQQISRTDVDRDLRPRTNIASRAGTK